jgi:hypothetical protein
LLALPLSLGLFGIIEPRALGSSSLFVGHVNGSDNATKVGHVIVLTVTRTVSPEVELLLEARLPCHVQGAPPS